MLATLVVKLLCAICAYSIAPHTSNFVQGLDGLSRAWDTRIGATLALLQSKPCWGLSSKSSHCDSSTFANLDTRTMRLYTAQSQKKSNLRVVLPDKKQRRLTMHSHRNDSYDAIFVLDPYPDTNFGHIVFIFLVDFDVNQTACNKSMNGVHVFTGRDECIRRADKSRHCKNRVHPRQVKCEINFIPLVHSKDDKSQAQLLECSQSPSFAKCGVLEDFQLPCSDNSPRCMSGSGSVRPEPEELCTYETCDYAVLVSGGWNSYTSRPQYRKNLHNFWKLLHSFMHYKRKHIVTFFGQGQKSELAVHQRDRSYAVKSATGVKEYIRKLCRSALCTDTVTIYLTGPSMSDGSLLFWDNGNGLTDSDSELYTPRQLLEDVKNCSAKRLFIVADYSYSGAMINRFNNRIRRHPDHFKNVMAISSSSWDEYSWRSEFTEAFVKRSKEGKTTKCVKDVFKEIKQEFQASGSPSLTPQKTDVVSNATSTTLTGRRCNETWREAKAAPACERIPISIWRPILEELGKN